MANSGCSVTLGQGAGRVCSGRGRCAYACARTTIDAEGVEKVRVADLLVEEGLQLPVIHSFRQVDNRFRLEKGDRREGGSDLGGRAVYPPVGPDLVDNAVRHHHFAVEALKGADAQIAVAEQFLQGHFAVVHPRQQGVDGGGLGDGIPRCRREAAGQQQHDEGK